MKILTTRLVEINITQLANVTDLSAAMMVSKRRCILERRTSPVTYVKEHLRAAMAAGDIQMKEEGGSLIRECQGWREALRLRQELLEVFWPE